MIWPWIVGGLLLARSVAGVLSGMHHPSTITAVHPTPSASSSAATTH